MEETFDLNTQKLRDTRSSKAGCLVVPTFTYRHFIPLILLIGSFSINFYLDNIFLKTIYSTH